MRFVKIFFAVLIVLGVAIAFFPWKSLFLEKEIVKALAEKGFDNPALTIEGVLTNRITIRNFSAGEALRAGDLEATYQAGDVLAGRVHDVRISDVTLMLKQDKGKWLLEGFTPVSKNDGVWNVPLTPEDVARILPFQTLRIEQGKMDVSGSGWRAEIPFTAHWEKGLGFSARDVTFEAGEQKLIVRDLQADVSLGDQKWQGEWSLKNPEIGEIDGAISLNEKEAVVTGEIKSAGTYGAVGSFSLRYLFLEKKAVLHLAKISMPWSGGSLSVKNTDIPLDGDKPVTIPVQFSNVSVENLMSMITGEYITGTGTISGVLPVVVMPDGNVSVGNGTLKADHDGKLSVPPEVIPGEGAQIEMTRDIMKDFRYKSLNLNVQAQPDGSLSVLVAVQGNNPDLYDGRLVNLNVRLGGDVLDFVRSNVMMLLQPESLLKQEQK